MSVTYTCPACKTKLKAPKAVAPGKSVTCPKCEETFKPEGEAAPGAEKGVFKLADEPAKKPAAPAKPGAKPEEPKKEEPAPAAKKPFLDDDEDDASVKKGYAVIQETEEQKKEAEKNKPKFGETQDKYKKSARGPAQGLLVMPSNLLIGEGLLTGVGGIVLFVLGMWPLTFNDAPPGEEELDEAIIYMLLGLVTFAWGAMVCWGASHMQELGSYPLAMAGAVMGVVPLLVGIFGIVMLQNPKVKAGFEESEGESDSEDEDEEGEKDEDDDEEEDEDEEDDDEDDEDDEESGAGKTAKKAAKKVGRRLLKGMLGGGEDEEDE